MKYFLLITLAISPQAFAGNNSSSMHSGLHGGCTDVRIFNPRKSGIAIDLGGQPRNQTTIDLNQHQSKPAEPAPAPQGPSLSESKANDLREHYTRFNTIDRPSETQVAAFITQTSEILLRYPEHNPIAKRRWSGESRLAYKILFGMICYIGNSDTEVASWLTRDGGLTSDQMTELDQFRSGVGAQQLASMIACVVNVLGCQRMPLQGIVSTFLNRL